MLVRGGVVAWNQHLWRLIAPTLRLGQDQVAWVWGRGRTASWTSGNSAAALPHRRGRTQPSPLPNSGVRSSAFSSNPKIPVSPRRPSSISKPLAHSQQPSSLCAASLVLPPSFYPPPSCQDFAMHPSGKSNLTPPCFFEKVRECLVCLLRSCPSWCGSLWEACPCML